MRTGIGAAQLARGRAGDLKSLGIEIYHAQNTGCEESPIAARLAGVPIVLGTFHTDPTYDLDGERNGLGHRAIEWVSNRCLHHAIAVSEATKQSWVRRTRIAESRVTMIHNGVCPERFQRKRTQEQARRELGLPVDKQLIGAVGRLDRAKGHKDLVEAFAMIAADHRGTDIVIAGGGPLRERLEQQAAKLGLQGRVHFLGHCSDIGLAYDALDIYTMPSLCEALPFALLEAMAHGLPCITSTAGGMPEVVADGETGLLHDIGDAEGLARSLTTLIESQDLRKRFGSAGRKRVEQHFTEEQMVSKTLAVYEMLIESRPRKRKKSS